MLRKNRVTSMMESFNGQHGTVPAENTAAPSLLAESTVPAALAEAAPKKSSWPEFVTQAEKGLAYLGSKFNFTPEQMIDAIEKNKINTKTMYVDRKLDDGSSVLRLNKLDKKGKVVGNNGLTKVGKVYRYKDFFIIHNEKDGDNVVAYAIPDSVNEALTEAGSVHAVKSADDWVLRASVGDGYGLSNQQVVAVLKGTAPAPTNATLSKHGADSAIRFSAIRDGFKGDKGYTMFMRQLSVAPKLSVAPNLSEASGDEYEELINWLESLARDIPAAIKELKRERVGYATSNVVGRAARTTDERWYKDMFR